MNVCTIVARNYLAQACVLGDSLAEHNPGSTLTILVLDAGEDTSGLVDHPTIGLHEIGIDEREVHRMAMSYDVLELATAVKPWLLETLLARGAGEVVYLDPDIEVFGDLSLLPELARAHGIALTPHVTAPLPEDGGMPDETALLLAGVYNLGFIAVSARALPFLSWWTERLRRDCYVRPEQARFVDQRWVDLVPGYFEPAILRDPGYNVAYWNLATRRVREVDGRFEVDGRPLRFFHYSGFDVGKPWLLSKHQGPNPRVLLSEDEALAGLCAAYARRVIGRGAADFGSIPYGFDTLPSGIAVDGRMRRLYREALVDAEREDAVEPPDPFDPASAQEFVDWLNEPFWERSGAQVSRYLHEVWERDPELRASFPDPRWGDGDGFLEWARRFGMAEYAIPPELVPGPRSPDPVPAHAAEHAEGVNVIGYLRAELGIGEAARLLAAALEHAGVPVATRAYTRTLSRQSHGFQAADIEPGPYDVNLVCVNADQVPAFCWDAGSEVFAGRTTVGVWFWELPTFPFRQHRAFESVDEVWVATRFVRDAIAPATDKPVVVVPLPVPARAPRVVDRRTLGLPEGFLFLFAFDFLSSFDRKNPLGLVDAFRRAFAPGEGPSLVVKSINGDRRVAELEALRAAAAGRPDVVLVDEYFDADATDALMAACDCYVSLHRSEGFGLTLAHAMSRGKPVIATGYSGNVDFMDGTNSLLVGYREARVPRGSFYYPPGLVWAEPDLDEAASFMRRVAERPEEAAELGAAARASITELLSVERIGALAAARIDEIRAGRAPRAAPRVEREPTGTDRAERWLREGPSQPWHQASRLGWPGLIARRAVLRAIRPYATRVREFETAVVDGLRQAEEADDTVRREAHLLDDRVSALDERVNRRLAELDAKVARLSPPRPAAAPSGGGDAPEEEVPLLASDPPFRPGDPPIPPLEMRQLIGREDPAAFDNPSGALVFPDLAAEQYSAVFDFGCGCGRLARMLVQQRPRPSRYVGVDLHRGMVAWCTRNLTPYAPGFEFVHHDVYTAGFNPGGAREPVPFPVEDGAFSLVTALSVFTHLVEEHARFYLHECSRILRDDGLIRSTWFLFDKRYYPMMQDFQNALYINLVDPTNAVVFDRDWLTRQLEEAGLALVAAAPPAIRGFQWTLDLRRAGRDATPVGLPDDLAPFGSKPPPVPTFDPSRVA